MERELTRYELESQTQVKDAVNMILRELNGGNRKVIADAIVDTVSHDHRTLQQAFWSAMMLAQIKYVKIHENAHDLRNEDAVRLARTVKEAAEKLNLDYGLPYI